MERPPILLRKATEMLEASFIPRPRWTAEQLLSHRLKIQPIELYLRPERSFPEEPGEEAALFLADVAARAGGMPLQYLLGKAAFYGRDFDVGPGVFIPRPETEILVETAVDILRSSATSVDRFPRQKVPGRPDPYCDPYCVDVGTGCGAIAITLALEVPGVRVVGIDVSSTALSFAESNALKFHVPVSFFQGDLIQAIRPNSVDLLVANLPYLDPSQAQDWPRELRWEPWITLDGGDQGLSLIQRLLGQAVSVLKTGGKLLLEIDAGQVGRMVAFARGHGLCVDRLKRDLAGLHRVMVLWKS